MDDEHYDDAETAKRRDDIVRRMIDTPPQPKRKPKAESSPPAKPAAKT